MNIEVGLMDISKHGCSSCDDVKDRLGIYVRAGCLQIRLCQKCGHELAAQLEKINCVPDRQESHNER